MELTNTVRDRISENIEADDYLRQRFSPRFGDPLYLHLSDLRLAMNSVGTDQNITLLDFGCGGSPYRPLFPNADYRRADYAGTEGIHYVIDDGSSVQEAANTFDVVLSTQVLEHASSPKVYLAECFRLLKNGGTLVLTTHGTYEEHDCPYDYQRWTADGLTAVVQAVGFKRAQVVKLTTGARAMMFLLELYRNRFGTFPNEPFGNAMASILQTINGQQAAFHQWCDALYPNHRLVSAKENAHAFYIALMLVAYKPTEDKDCIPKYDFGPDSIF